MWGAAFTALPSPSNQGDIGKRAGRPPQFIVQLSDNFELVFQNVAVDLNKEMLSPDNCKDMVVTLFLAIFR